MLGNPQKLKPKIPTFVFNDHPCYESNQPMETPILLASHPGSTPLASTPKIIRSSHKRPRPDSASSGGRFSPSRRPLSALANSANDDYDFSTPLRHKNDRFLTPRITPIRSRIGGGDGELFNGSEADECMFSDLAASPPPPTTLSLESYPQISAVDLPFTLNVTSGAEERLKNLTITSQSSLDSGICDSATGSPEMHLDHKVTRFLTDPDMAQEMGWRNWGQLGEGAFAHVSLYQNLQTKQAFAIKQTDLRHFPHAQIYSSNEVQYLSRLQHPNIVKFYGWTKEGTSLFMFLEYIPCGELFEQIVPEIGIKSRPAMKYFSQLLSAVEYMHSLGVAHRDLKPENLLLDQADNLKVIDFGYACRFNPHTKTAIKERVGTEPYMAPEMVRNVPYYPPLVDIWACGIILFGMLAGELPWNIASKEDELYNLWKEGKIMIYNEASPWRKMDPEELALVRKILHSSPSRRATIDKIRQDPLYRRLTEHQNNASESPFLKKVKRARPTTTSTQPVAQLHHHFDNSNSNGGGGPPSMFWNTNSTASSQLPIIRSSQSNENVFQPPLPKPPMRRSIPEPFVAYSQPANLKDIMLDGETLSPIKRVGASQRCSPRTVLHNRMNRIVKRMTRFFSTKDVQKTGHILCYALEKLGYRVDKIRQRELLVSQLSGATRNSIKLRIDLVTMKGGQVLVDFRRISGDVFEFKKHFMKIKECLEGDEDGLIDLATPMLLWQFTSN